ncbi:FxLYD domain-containing protein [Aeromicrobium sp. Sec7.5]|uniref:FxLYD domain-containing protein n=1 Tax=Aeromicrobium sp. Sec7.5 TaxID=3121276 RepID=UPI002FE4E887
MIRHAVAVAAVLVSAVTSSGCSHDTPESSHDDVHVDPGGDAAHLPPIPDMDGAEGAVADATFDDCATTPGPHVVRGTVENSADEAMTYVVAVSWIDREADVAQRGVAEMVDVPAGDSADFTVTADVPDGVTSCTYYVLRAPTD